MDNIRENSNGESAFRYFTERIDRRGLYLLDEPENSISPQRQIELIEYIENSARFFQSQFIIATHSPFLLSLKGAKIYDLNQPPASAKSWTQLDIVRKYYKTSLRLTAGSSRNRSIVGSREKNDKMRMREKIHE